MEKKEVFEQIKHTINSSCFNKEYKIREYADWCARIIIPAEQFESWFDGIEDLFDERMKAIGETDWTNRFFNAIFQNIWDEGIAPSGCSEYKLPRGEEFNALRKEVLESVSILKSLGLTENLCDTDICLEHLWFKEDGEYQPIRPYICVKLSCKSLSDWRDFEYNRYSRSYTCLQEHRAEKEAEQALAEHLGF